MDTQDGIMGTNMYAYCQNDPVNFYDPSGMLARTTIHNIVVREVAERHSLHREQTITYAIGWGRADLISAWTGEVWDVKRYNPNNKNPFSQMAQGVKQVQKYTENTWKKRPPGNQSTLKPGGAFANGLPIGGAFTREIAGETYLIGYMYDPRYPGVIGYNYAKISSLFEKVHLPDFSNLPAPNIDATTLSILMSLLLTLLPLGMSNRYKDA